MSVNLAGFSSDGSSRAVQLHSCLIAKPHRSLTLSSPAYHSDMPETPLKQATPVIDRLRGTMLGLAAGDRIGGPIRMALELAESLAACGRFAPEDVQRRYLAWWRREGFDAGPVTTAVLTMILRGTAPAVAVAKVDAAMNGKTAGCNPAHRALPLALCAFLPKAALGPAARTEARLTHQHPLAGEIAAATVLLGRACVQGQGWADALTQAGVTVPATIRPTGFAPDTLGAAVYFVEHATGFPDALQQALAFAGPENYCPVLAGALAGARWGASTIPESELTHLRREPALYARIEQVCEKLAPGWEQYPRPISQTADRSPAAGSVRPRPESDANTDTPE